MRVMPPKEARFSAMRFFRAWLFCLSEEKNESGKKEMRKTISFSNLPAFLRS
jgi:hypothetical protein